MKYLKTRHVEEEDNEGSWAISYGDMITLLLSFFVLFFTADFKGQKVENMNRHLLFDLDQMDLHKNKKASAVNPLVAIPGIKELDIKAHQVGENLVITFGKKSFFESGKTYMREDVKPLLKSFVEKYLPYSGKYQLSVKGFTDRLPVTKRHIRYADNLELSALRAVTTMRELQKLGIPLNRMEIAGVGEMRSIERILPKSANLTPEEINSISRTIVLVIKPERETWL